MAMLLLIQIEVTKSLLLVNVMSEQVAETFVEVLASLLSLQ